MFIDSRVEFNPTPTQWEINNQHIQNVSVLGSPSRLARIKRILQLTCTVCVVACGARVPFGSPWLAFNHHSIQHETSISIIIRAYQERHQHHITIHAARSLHDKLVQFGQGTWCVSPGVLNENMHLPKATTLNPSSS